MVTRNYRRRKRLVPLGYVLVGRSLICDGVRTSKKQRRRCVYRNNVLRGVMCDCIKGMLLMSRPYRPHFCVANDARILAGADNSRRVPRYKVHEAFRQWTRSDAPQPIRSETKRLFCLIPATSLVGLHWQPQSVGRRLRQQSVNWIASVYWSSEASNTESDWADAPPPGLVRRPRCRRPKKRALALSFPITIMAQCCLYRG